MNAIMRDLLGSVFMLMFVVSLWVQRDFTTPFGGIFPDIWIGALVGLVAITVVLTWTPWGAFKNGEENGTTKGGHWFDMAVVGVIMLAWTVLLRYLGFLTTGIVGFATISWFLNDRRNSLRGLAESVVVGAAMVGLLILVFEYGLKVPLPKGTFFD